MLTDCLGICRFEMQTALMMTTAPARPLAVAQPRLPQRTSLQILHAKKETSSGQDSYSKIEAPGESKPAVSVRVELAEVALPGHPSHSPVSRLTGLCCTVRGEIPDGGQPVAERDADSRGILTRCVHHCSCCCCCIVLQF